MKHLMLQAKHRVKFLRSEHLPLAAAGPFWYALIVQPPSGGVRRVASEAQLRMLAELLSAARETLAYVELRSSRLAF